MKLTAARLVKIGVCKTAREWFVVNYPNGAVVDAAFVEAVRAQNKDWPGCAAGCADPTLAAEFLDNGVNVNARDEDGWTPLQWAAKGGHTATARMLIERGAKVNTRNRNGYTPLHYAAKGGHTATARMLIERGAKLNTRDKAGITPLCWAWLTYHRNTERLIKKHGGKR